MEGSLGQMFTQTTRVDNLIRSLKYLRIVLLLLRTTVFKEIRMITQTILETSYNLKNMIVLWFVFAFIFSVMCFNLFSYRNLVNSDNN